MFQGALRGVEPEATKSLQHQYLKTRMTTEAQINQGWIFFIAFSRQRDSSTKCI